MRKGSRVWALALACVLTVSSFAAAAPAGAVALPSAGVSVLTISTDNSSVQIQLVGAFLTSAGQFVGLAKTGGLWSCDRDGCFGINITSYGTTNGPWPIASADGVSMTGLCEWFGGFLPTSVDSDLFSYGPIEKSSLTCDLSFQHGPSAHLVLSLSSLFAGSSSTYPGVFTG